MKTLYSSNVNAVVMPGGNGDDIGLVKRYKAGVTIDFHTHFFPDSVAAGCMAALSARGGVGYHGNGTLGGLVSFMDGDRVDISVNLPVATQPDQVQGINRRMIELNAGQARVVCFGAMHPLYEGYADEIARLASNGIKGIKLHSEYQMFRPDEERMFPVYEACARHRIIVVFHTGYDFGCTEVRCTPERLKQVLSVPGLTAVFAHMGGYRMWGEAEKHLVGTGCYFDLGCCAEMECAQLRGMITAHGADRVLFASDFPWERASNVRRRVESLGLAGSQLEQIFHLNAACLLGLPAGGGC